MDATCDWSQPGLHKYEGTARAAIMAYAEIPKQIRLVLVARAEAQVSDYDDVVTIDRNSITGKFEYASELKYMHFGRNGKICGAVTRDSWTPEHIERAMVFCAGGYCVARPEVCGNWSMVTRIEPAKREESFSDTAIVIIAEAPPAPVFIDQSMTITVDAPTYGGDTWIDSWSGAGYGAGGGWFGGGGWSPGAPPGHEHHGHKPPPCEACIPCPPPVSPPVTAVPELATWLLMIFGIAAIALWRVRR